MKILFINLSSVKFTVITPDHEPLGGSESCVCYLARQFQQNSHDVSLVSRLPDDTPPIINGIRHYSLETIKHPSFFKDNFFDVILVCNAPSISPILKALTPRSRILLWNHVLPDQPSMKDLGNHEIMAALDAIIYVSEWQKEETESQLKIKKKSYVVGNGLTPAFENMFSSPQEILAAKKNQAVYTAVPFRGLQVLLSVMETLYEDTNLELFSSLRVYQLQDDEFRALYQKAALNPRITSHGSVSQPELARHLKSSAFLTYPCIYAETYCIGALEALAAGMKIIATSLGALPTTTMGYADLIDIRSNKADELVHDFRNTMIHNIKEFLQSPQEWSEQRFTHVKYANQECIWPARYKIWDKILASPQE